MIDLPGKIAAARAFLAARHPVVPEIGIILGTGLGPLANSLDVGVEIPYADIPHFARPTAEGHEGQWISGTLGGKNVAVMQGRFHYYEGHAMEDIAFPVRVLRALGARAVVVTNIAGGVNADFRLGDLMIVTDHINFLGTNPLIGPNHESVGPRFPDMSDPYHRGYVRLLAGIGSELGLRLRRGVYGCMSGPCLETAAEYRMLRTLGVDAVGMSTVPEVIAAVHCGLKVAALSLITDVCDPDDLKPVDIPAIFRVVGEAEPKLAEVVARLVAGM
jgi:purine-nucleoside phosphorylase